MRNVILFSLLALALGGCTKPSQVEYHKPTCQSLVSDVIDLWKKNDGPHILELDDPRDNTGDLSLQPSCFGDAITDRGHGAIEYGIEESPQGAAVLHLKYQQLYN